MTIETTENFQYHFLTKIRCNLLNIKGVSAVFGHSYNLISLVAVSFLRNAVYFKILEKIFQNILIGLDTFSKLTYIYK